MGEKTDWQHCLPYSTIGKWLGRAYRDIILFGFGLFLGASLVGYFLVIKKDDLTRGMRIMEQILKDNPDYCQKVIVKESALDGEKPTVKRRGKK